MEFTPIDLNVWPRAQMFYYFAKMAPTGYSLTVKMDITKLYQFLKEKHMKFFPAYLWLVTRNLNKQEEFKIALKEEKLGFYDTLTPLYAAFHEDTHTFSLMWTEYQEDFNIFYKQYLENQKNYGDTRGVLSQPQTPPPENAYTVSCLPWVSFEYFAIHSYENKEYYFPSIEAGKFYEEAGKIWLPLSLTCHHATTDGYHVNCFLEQLQEDMNQMSSFLQQ